MFKLLSSVLLLGVLGGCMVEDNHPAATHPLSQAANADSPAASTAAVALAGTGGESVPIGPGRREFNYREPGTGVQYLINPQWKIMTRPTQGSLSSAAAFQTWTDWSGQVETRIYECASPTFTNHQNSIGCQVEADFIVVGGGAYAEYLNGAGAFLWETRPLDPNLSTWVASSKDHEVSSFHRLFVYAVGLRLKDYNGNVIPRALIKERIHMTGHSNRTPSHTPVDSVGELLDIQRHYFGTGARLNWTCCGALLTKSKAKYDWRWMIGVAAGKDHRMSDPSTIDVYGVVIEADQTMTPARVSPIIPGFGRLEFKILEAAGGTMGLGVAVTLLDVEPGYALTGIGGESKWTSGIGRMLFGMKPTGTFTGQIGVYSKDHRSKSGGYNVATLVQVRRAF